MRKWKHGGKVGVLCDEEEGEDEDPRGEMRYLEGGWAYTGFCRAVHPAGVSLQVIKSSHVKGLRERYGKEQEEEVDEEEKRVCAHFEKQPKTSEWRTLEEAEQERTAAG